MPSTQSGNPIGVALASVLALAACSMGTANAGATVDGVSSYSSVYPTLDTDAVIRLAVNGDVLAQQQLGTRLAQGNGLPLNRSAAAYWYSLAASRGFPGAASIDPLPNFPIFEASVPASSLASAPTARLSVTSPSPGSLTATIDATASSDNAGIIRYVWSVVDENGNNINLTLGNQATGSVDFPEPGSFFVTVSVVDTSGLIHSTTEKVVVDVPAEPDPPEAPTLTAPLASGTVQYNTSVDFVWAAEIAAERYAFELYTAMSSPAEAVVTADIPAANCVNDNCQVTVLFDFTDFGDYTWRVRATNGGGESSWSERSLTLLPPIPAVPMAITPIAGTDINEAATVQFTWAAAEFATGYEMHFFDRVASDEVSFIRDIDAATICNDGECSLAVTLNLPVSDNHAWRVRAANAAGFSGWSRTEFNVIEPITDPPEEPAILLPLAGNNVESGQLTSFTWSVSNLATAYEFRLFGSNESPPDPSLTINAVINGGSCNAAQCVQSQIVSLPVGNEYRWEVRAINPVGASEWVNSTFYLIEAAETRPDTPDPVLPLANADINHNEPATFTWLKDPQAATYDFHFFNNSPVDGPGALPFVIGLSPRDLCANDICSYTTTPALPIYTQHAWRVRAVNSKGTSGWSRQTFNVVEPVTEPPLAPTPLTPLPMAMVETETTTTFSWEPALTASRYELMVVDTDLPEADPLSAFVQASGCQATRCTLPLDLALPVGNTYEWQLRAVNAAGESDWVSSPFGIIAKATQPPPTPENLLPAVQAQLSQGDDATFTWVRDTHAVTYEFHFFNGAEGQTTPFIVGLRPDELCSDTQCAYTLPVDLPVATNHAWRVRGLNSLGYSAWSRTAFEVIETLVDPPGVFELTAPLDEAVITQAQTITFLWTRAARATEFEWQLIDGSQDPPAISSETVLASACDTDFCSLTRSVDLPPSDQHGWQVRAINTVGQSAWQSATFTVEEAPVDQPPPPIIIAPLANEAVITGAEVAFQWQAVNDAISYEFHISDAVGQVQVHEAQLLPESVCVESLCTHVQTVDLPVSDLHSWHVRALLENTASEWSDVALNVNPDPDASEPIAAFTVVGFTDQVAGMAPLTLLFDPTASSDDAGITEFEWQFGDGSDSVSSNSAEPVEHTFSQPGSYTVQLTVSDDAGLSSSTTRNVIAFDPAVTLSSHAASRFLAQASFGPTRASIIEVQMMGVENWLDEQFTRQGPPHLDYVTAYSNGSNRAPRHEIWWSDVVKGDDQLRQRVAFALSQLFVVSDTGYTLSNSQYGITHYYDMLRENAFGNYRDLLEHVTLSPIMGLYLSMLQNAKNDPAASTRADENYAREVLQLFSIGLHVLNIDGTTDGTPVFTQDQVEAFARVFTGWNYADAGQWNRAPFTGADLISPMRPFESFHDTDAKALLNGAVAPAGSSARQDLEFALDNIFNHPNVGPFIAKQLIKRLVTSNPSPAYVQRIATVFNDDGTGVRGNLQAVIRALLLDTEARVIPNAAAYGKLREPVLRLSHLWRAFNVQPGTQASARQEYNTGSPELFNLDDVTGQAVLKSPSVFNFFQPDFSPAGPVADQNLVAPEFELFTDSNELATSNRIGRQIQEAYLGNPDSNGRRTAYLDFSYERSLAANPDRLLDHLNTVLLSGNLSADSRTVLLSHLEGLPDTEQGLSLRVRDAVTLIMASPDYLVQM